MSIFKEYSEEALPVIKQLIDLCENVASGRKLADLLEMLEDARDEIEEKENV
jgi:hypothetical protein